MQTDNFNLIFIVGVGRSGTSLLQSMFAAHPAISCLPETAFLRRYGSTGILQSLAKSSGVRSAVAQLESDSAFKRTKLDAGKLARQAITHTGGLDLRIYQGMLRAYATQARHWLVDKDPRMIEFLPLLKLALPNVQIINVIRDPRDVVASKKRAAWSRSGHVWKHIFANRVQLLLGRDFGRRLFGEMYHEVTYENLISAPHEVLSDLCSKLGLPYNSSMLEFSDAAEKLVARDEISWKRETLGPLLTNNRGKWLGDLSCREVKLTESCCGEAMRLGNYSFSENCAKLGFAETAWTILGKSIIFMYTRPYVEYRRRRLKVACKRMT